MPENDFILPAVDEISLWPHQWQALSTIKGYVSSFRTGYVTGSGLVHMPTGSGKTGVMAVASFLMSGVGSVLVLTPRVALRDQLFRELNGRFFGTSKFKFKDLPKKLINAASSAELENEDFKNSIVITTFQLLHSLTTSQDEALAKLRGQVELVLIDEGHYEPALYWRESIRAFQVPRVVFTATPFRNDLKLFDVDLQHAFNYTFTRAQKENVIRSVQFHERPRKGTPAAFVGDVISFYESTFNAQLTAATPPRVIIRCDSQASIREIGAALKAKGKSHVLIHENFLDNGSQQNEYRTVPDTRKNSAIYWVHQFKLLEGIDDSSFQLLALFEELGSAKSLVQQVGRVVRNPSLRADQVAHVLDHADGRQKELWESFLKFDEGLEKSGLGSLSVGEKFLEAVVSGLPEVVYFDRRFRHACDISALDVQTELMLPLGVHIFRKRGTSNFQKMGAELLSEYTEQDKKCEVFDLDKQTRVIVYVAIRNSPLLRSSYFVEPRLGVSVLKDLGKHVFFYDSGTALPACISDAVTFLSPQALRRLFKGDKGGWLTFVNLRNSNVSPRAVRTRAISAANIGDTAPVFDDAGFVCAAARGYFSSKGKATRRYIGFNTGRVSDFASRRVTLSSYLAWLAQLDIAISKPKRDISEFSRYARPTTVPADPEPVHVLLELSDLEEEFVTNPVDSLPADQPLEIEDACAEVVGGSFQVQANGKRCSAQIRFDAATERYLLDSSDLESLYYSENPELRRGLVNVLNRKQAFRVIPKSEGQFYAYGTFYKPNIVFGPDYDDDQTGILRVLTPADCVEKIGSEKGKACAIDGSSWDPSTLFGIIDVLGKGHGLESLFNDPDILVCDDMETEAADFILADTLKRRVVFIHAKGQEDGVDSRKYAASPLEKVCGQAVKNLKYLLPFSQEVPPKVKKWDTQAWAAPKDVQGIVKKRIRKCPKQTMDGPAVWKEIRSVIRDPLSDREVWLFLGRLLSHDSLEKQLLSKKPATEAKQTAFLLLSTISTVTAAGAKLRIICSP